MATWNLRGGVEGPFPISDSPIPLGEADLPRDIPQSESNEGEVKEEDKLSGELTDPDPDSTQEDRRLGLGASQASTVPAEISEK